MNAKTHKNLEAKLLFCAVYFAAFVTFGMLFYIIGYILVKGIPHLSLDFFSLTYNSDNVSIQLQWR